MPIQPQPPSAEQPSAYLPPGPPPLVFEKFQGINTSTSRPGVSDEQMWWSENMFPIGPRMLRSFPDVGPALWDLSETEEPDAEIVYYDFANIGPTPIAIVILSSGSIYQVNTTTGVGLRIATVGTIINPNRTGLDITQQGSTAVIIVAFQTDGYFIWDGLAFYAPGSAYGGGFVPTGLGGNAVELYSGRVWVATGPTITFSAPGSIIDFSSGSGGGQFTSSDSFLRVTYTALVQSSGFLYLVGDSSVNYISGVQTSGSPPVTAFTNQNADPEVGTPWPNTVTTFGRNILFANAFGAHVSYGAAVTKISEPLDGVYNTVVDFGGFIPSAAKTIIYGKKCWCLLLPVVDPLTGRQRRLVFVWIGKTWVPASQSIDLIFIQHQEIASVITAWGTDGFSLYPMFQRPSTQINKIAQSRFWDTPVGIQTTKATNRLWGLIQFYSLPSTDITVDIDNEAGTASKVMTIAYPGMSWANDANLTMTWQNNAAQPMTWLTSSLNIVTLIGPEAVAQNGVLLGLTLRSTNADFALIMLMLQPEIVQART